MEATWIEHIEAFLDGNISRAELEARTAGHSGAFDLDQEIEWVRNTRMSIEMAGLRQLIQETLVPEKPPLPFYIKNSFWRFALSLAATVLLLVAGYLGLRPDMNERLYARYAYTAPSLPILMSQSDNYLLYDALTFYGEGDYKESATRLAKIQDQDNDTLNFYLGASLLYTGSTFSAEKALQQVVSTESLFREKAEWLLVLTALKARDQEKLQKYLEPIVSNRKHAFHTEALALKQDAEK